MDRQEEIECKYESLGRAAQKLNICYRRDLLSQSFQGRNRKWMEQVNEASNCMQRSAEVWWNIRKHTVRKQPYHDKDRKRWSVIERIEIDIKVRNDTQ